MIAVSFFAGVGGFDAALLSAGHEIVGACEIDERCRKVYAARFGEPRWFARDICEVRAEEIPEADLWCGGWPCVDNSVAGKRAGMADDSTRSGLWWTWQRLMAARRPAMVLAENVPGLLSVNGGRDFGAVIASLLVVGYRVAWTTIDARFMGVAQRRRRIFLCASLSGDPRAVLFDAGTEPPSNGAPAALVRGDWHASQEALFARHGDAPFDGAAWPGNGYAAGDRCWTRDVPEWRDPVERASLAATLEVGPIPARFFLSARACAGILRRAEKRGRALPEALDAALRATAGVGQAFAPGDSAEPLAFGANRTSGPREEAGALSAHGGASGRALVIAGQQHGSDVGAMGALRAGHGDVQSGVPFVALDVFSFESRVARNGRGAPSAEVPPLKTQSGADGRGDGAPLIAFGSKDSGADCGAESPTLRAAGHLRSHANAGAPPAVSHAGRIRRLTPTETERLQSFADGHTCLCDALPCRNPEDCAPAWWPAAIRQGGCGHAACGCKCGDGKRYAEMGNAVCVSVVRWIAGRLDHAQAQAGPVRVPKAGRRGVPAAGACVACGAPVQRQSSCAWHDADGPLHVACLCPACARGEREAHRHREGVDCPCSAP